jgi:hypothetical protein
MSCVRLYWQVPPPNQTSNNVHINCFHGTRQDGVTFDSVMLLLLKSKRATLLMVNVSALAYQ